MHQAMFRDQGLREADEVFLKHPLSAVCFDDLGILRRAVKKARHQWARVALRQSLLFYISDKRCPICAASGRGQASVTH